MMNNINKTMYIPLFGKSYVSKKGIILQDKMAEEIWAKEGFELKGKSATKWLAYYMGMRARVFDDWVSKKMSESNGVVLHLGCGLDSRAVRVAHKNHHWYDVDFESVIEERKKYYAEDALYTLIASDVRNTSWLTEIKEETAFVIMEGISMYLQIEETQELLKELGEHFKTVHLLVDVYTEFAAKASKIKNPINDVGVTDVTGFDDPMVLCDKTGFEFVAKCEMTPQHLIDELTGLEKGIFKTMYAGSIADKTYRLYEYVKK